MNGLPASDRRYAHAEILENLAQAARAGFLAGRRWACGTRAAT